MKLDDISKCISWMIKEDYLLELNMIIRLPLLLFSEKGWQIEKHLPRTFKDVLRCRRKKGNNVILK